MRVRIETIGGIPTRYYYEGSGHPLLLIHGAGVSSDSWIRNIDALGKNFRVVAPDTLGHGFTGAGDYTGGPPHPHILDHLSKLIDHLGFEEFYVAGSSFGALIGALLYFKYPKRVKKLVIISSGSFANSDEELVGAVASAYENSRQAVVDPTAESCRERMARIFYSRQAIPEELVVMQLTIAALPGIQDAFETRMRGMMDIEACRPYRVLDRLEAFKVPCLLLWGRDDTRGLYDRAAEAADRMPDAHLLSFQHCKHHPHIEHPEKFNEILTRFLKGDTLPPHRSVI